MTVEEDKISADIKSGSLSRVYYLYGEEVFSTQTYTKRIIHKTVGDNPDDINLVKLSGAVSVELLSDSVESMPLFADSKAVLINDLNCDELTDSDNERLIEILKDVPPECTVIISITGITIDGRKKSANKNLITVLSKQKDASVCCFKKKTTSEIAGMIIKKAARRGCVISRQNAAYIAEMTLGSLTLCSNETEKLCDYAGSGEITLDMIDRLGIKQLDTAIYTLANTITAGKRKEAFMILDDLFAQRIDAIPILASLSSAYLDYYRAMTALSCGKKAETVAADFGYAKNRAFVVTKSINTVSRLPRKYITDCISLLYEADRKMKTSGCNNRIILEKTVAALFLLKNESAGNRR